MYVVAGVVAIGSGVMARSLLAGPSRRVPATPSAAARVLDGLCSTRDAVAAGDVNAGRQRFYNQAHQGLHDLARAVGASDRPAEARLLEAKQRVEAGLDEPTPALAADLDALIAATSVATAADLPCPTPAPPETR